MENYFNVENLSVGYDGEILIHDINFQVDKGSVLTLIGPNGAGKSTILKTLTRHLDAICGSVFVLGRETGKWSAKEMAKELAVLLTDRICPELMTSAEVVSMGRYPYTNMFGKLTDADREKVENAMRTVHALDVAEQDFSTLSDGQRQRILLARAICQEPEIIILDEPTAYLDIRYKIELLDILREMSQEDGITVIMSLHEIDLAMKVSDYLMCIKGDTIAAIGRPEEILNDFPVEELYEIKSGSYNSLFGSVELVKAKGKPEVFVVAGGGYGIPYYRELQKYQIPFATGPLFDNDVDYQVAAVLTDNLISAPAFFRMDEKLYEAAADLLTACSMVLEAGTPVGELNEINERLLLLAGEKGIPVLTSLHRERVRI